LAQITEFTGKHEGGSLDMVFGIGTGLPFGLPIPLKPALPGAVGCRGRIDSVTTRG